MDRYIYYRAPVGKADLLRQRVFQMHELITAQTGVRCDFKRQAQPRDGLHTWMEIYCGIPRDFDERLHRFEVEAELPSLIVGARHVDDFVDCRERE